MMASHRPPLIRSRQFVALALIVAMTAAAPARGDLQRLVLDGQLDSSAGRRGVTLRLLCEPAADGGAISLELWVPQASTHKDFDYDDFEGPDAGAGDRALSRVSAIADSRTTEITHAAAGWYSGEDPDTFVFGLSQRSRHEGKIATWLGGIDAKSTRLVWVQRGFDDPKRELRATFPLDAATVARIRDTVGACLPRAIKSKPAKH